MRAKRWVAVLTALTLCAGLCGAASAAAVADTAADTQPTAGKAPDRDYRIGDGPDLVVSSLAWVGGDGQVLPGTTLTFAVTVKNQGTMAADEDVTVDIGFGREPLFRLTHEGGLAAGAEVTLYSPAWTAQSGDHMVTARVNSTDTVAEEELWDNDTLQRNLRIGTDRYEPAYDAVREAVAEAGMLDLTFNDDFNSTDDFDAAYTGVEGYKWYTKRYWEGPFLRPDEYHAENGVLTVEVEKDKYAVGATTIDLYSGIGYTFNHGYLEYRIRMPYAGEADESLTAVWSFAREKYSRVEPFDYDVEVDWMEYWGDNYYTVTLHEIGVNEAGEWQHRSSANTHCEGLGDEEWHVMGFLWEEGLLRCYLDGELYLTQTWSPDDIPMPPNEVREGDIVFDGVFSLLDAQDVMLFICGSTKIPLELDYLRIWQATEAVQAPAVTGDATTGTTVPVPQTGSGTTAAVSGDTAAPEAEGLSGWLWAAILGAVAVLGGAVVVLTVCRKRRQPQPVSEQSTGADDASGSESDGE